MKPMATFPCHHLLLLLLFLLTSFPSISTAVEDMSPGVTCPSAGNNDDCADGMKGDEHIHIHYNFDYDQIFPGESNSHDSKFAKGNQIDAMTCECPLEPRAFTELKGTVPHAIRNRLKELAKKAHMVESVTETATETVHSIDILKLFDESNPELDGIREDVHKGAKMLRTAFERIQEQIIIQEYVA